MPSKQARYWLLTIPWEDYTPFLHPDCSWIRGQLERGGDTGYLHWQVFVAFKVKCTLSKVKLLFGDRVHAEATLSKAAETYVWKDDTAVAGTRFDLGKKPMDRGSSKDWDSIVTSARDGDYASIPGDVLVRCYGNLKKIRVDSLKPVAQEKEVHVFWGRTGSGKSRRAWEEATWDAFPKDPCTKFWDGYTGQERVVIDEFRGSIGISHLLRWLDRYPCIVEVKGSSVCFQANKIWITSNLSPEDWYPDLDSDTKAALRRRFTTVTHFN